MIASKLMTTVLVAGMLAGCASHKYTVYFNPGSAALSADSKRIIKEAATMAKKKDAGTIKISGYTDSVGSKTMNKNLASKRVDTVARTLANLGVKSPEIKRAAHGEKWCTGYANHEHNDSSMRRVEIRLYKF